MATPTTLKIYPLADAANRSDGWRAKKLPIPKTTDTAFPLEYIGYTL